MNQTLLPSLRCLFIAILTALVISACNNTLSPNASTGNQGTSSDAVSLSSECRVIENDLGKTEICGQPQRVSRQPQRIIVLDQYILDLMLSLDVEPVGYAEDDRALVGLPQLGEPLAGVKYLGNYLASPPVHIGTRQAPSLEAILRLKPDLILAESYDPFFHNNLSKIAPALFFNTDYGFTKYGADMWQQDLAFLGQVLGREQRVKQVIEEHHQRVASARDELESVSRDQTVLLLWMQALKFSVETDRSFAGNLLDKLGFQLLIPEELPVTLYGEIPISLEFLPQLEPDFIIVMAYSDAEQVKAVWEQTSLLQALPATQAGEVYFVEYHLWGRARGPIAAELMIEQIQGFLSENTNQ